MMTTRIVFTALVTLLVSGCLPPDPTVGKGQVNLTPEITQHYDRYQSERSPGHFALSADGRYAHYNYCPDGRCLRGSKSQAIYDCEKISNGSPCKIYGAFGEVVWESPDG